MQPQQVINIGRGNFVITGRVVAIVNPSSSPMKRLREDARDAGRLVDATRGGKTRSILVTDSNHVILTTVAPETLSQRFSPEEASKLWKETA